jgi:tryptophan-rich sensory protein
MNDHSSPRVALEKPERNNRFGALVAWLGIVFVAAAIGGIGSADAPAFYAALDRPKWAPPAGLFGPVWSMLYALMAIAIWLVWKDRERHADAARLAVTLFALQLGANALWSWVFFVWQSGALALANILVLDALVVATILAFRRIHPLAAGLLLPYLAWIAFATALTWSSWQRNPGLL